MMRRLRLGRHAGAIYFAVACILAASLLMLRLRRPPEIFIEAARGALAVQAEGNGMPTWQSADGGSGLPSITETNVGSSEIKDDTSVVSMTSAEEPASGDVKAKLIYVHVAGQVAKPGLYGLPVDSRVYQAVEAAGGMTANADRDLVNIALPIRDGQQVFIPAMRPQVMAITPLKSATAMTQGTNYEQRPEEIVKVVQTEEIAEPPGRLDVTAQTPEQSGGDPVMEGAAGMIDINTAGQAELEQLPGIGPSLAVRIIEYRESKGPFASVEGLMDVSGIGPSKFAAMKDMVVVR